MALRVRLPIAGLLVLAAGLAGCASTGSGAAGAQQDAALMSASAEFSPQASPAASPIDAPADSTGSSSGPVPESDGAMLGDNFLQPTPTATNNGLCDQGLAYACGDTGPGGGVVFYASSSAFGCGPGSASLCNFLEVAPNGWNGTLVNCPKGCGGSPAKTSDYGSKGIGTGRGYAYCTGMGEKNLIPNASSRVIGAGYANTEAMVANCVAGDAGQRARSYTGGGLTDWYLPSVDELSALYYYPNRNAIGGFAADKYWSSTQEPTWAKGAWQISYSDSTESAWTKSSTFGVRPIRAF